MLSLKYIKFRERLMKSQGSSYERLVLAFLMAGLAFGLLIVAVRQSSSAQSSRERQVDNEIPKHVPIKVKLKAEKEKKFKARGNPNWVREFELEVTNSSDKPIYFLELWLELPETMSENNNPLAFSVRYGRGAFLHPETMAIPTDVPIQSGETHNFTIDEKWMRGWEQSKARRHLPDPGKVRIVLVHLSFGDGTGFDGGGEAYPYKRSNAQLLAVVSGI